MTDDYDRHTALSGAGWLRKYGKIFKNTAQICKEQWVKII